MACFQYGIINYLQGFYERTQGEQPNSAAISRIERPWARRRTILGSMHGLFGAGALHYLETRLANTPSLPIGVHQKVSTSPRVSHCKFRARSDQFLVYQRITFGTFGARLPTAESSSAAGGRGSGGRSGRVDHEVNEHTSWYNHWGQVKGTPRGLYRSAAS